MKTLLALVVGVAIGMQANNEPLDDVVRYIRALRETAEFDDLAASLRSHASHTLRGLSEALDPDTSLPGEVTDLVERVRRLAERP